jgi:PIN domain nuclease of toxin-antitoxin system
VVEIGAVIDTAPLLALLSGREDALGRAARRLVRRARRGSLRLALPSVCLFEVAQLEEKGRIELGSSFEEWCDRVEAAGPILLVALERAHVAEARSLPGLRDPFDRLIAGTAVALGVPWITADARVAGSGRVRVVW